MNQAARIKRNSIFALLSNVMRLGTNVLLFVGIARLYGPISLGQFTTAQTFSTLFLIFADFGFDILLATEIARDRPRSATLASRFLTLKIITASCSSVAMMFVPFLYSMSGSTKILTFVFALYVFFTSMQSFFFSLFKGLEQFEHETKIAFISNSLALALLIVFGLLHVPLIAFALLLILTRLVGIFLSLRVAKSVLSIHWFQFSLEGISEIWKKVLMFGAYTLCGILYFQMDTILLAFWKGDQAVGIYQAVFRIILLTLVITDVAINTLMPTLTRFHREGSEKWNQVGRLLYKMLFLLSLPITMILFVYAEQIIEILYGKEKFLEAIPILRIFSIIGFIRFIAEPFGLMLTTGNRQTIRTVISVGAALLNFSLNIYFIPKYGSMSAAQVSLVTNIFVAIAYLAATKPFLGSWIVDLATVVPFVMTIILSIVLWQGRNIPLWYIGFPSALLCLLISCWIGFKPSERKVLFTYKFGFETNS